MNRIALIAGCAAAVLAAGCAETPSFGGPGYGESPTAADPVNDRYGSIVGIEIIQVDEQYKLGVGTAVGAVAGALLGRQVGSGGGRTAATVAGAAAGAAAGTVAESKLRRRDAQRVTVRMHTGGQVTIVQPVDGRLQQGMNVVVQGSGETARVLPR